MKSTKVGARSAWWKGEPGPGLTLETAFLDPTELIE